MFTPTVTQLYFIIRGTGSQTSLNVTNNISDHRKPSPESVRQNCVTATVSANNLNEAIRRHQMGADFRNRGPPPQPPTPRNIAQDTTDSFVVPPARSPFMKSASASNSTITVTSTLHQNRNVHGSSSTIAVTSTLQPNRSQGSFLHGTLSNNASTTSLHNNNGPVKLAISHGKPNVAPKPPAIAPNKPATPPKKLAPVSRAHSMRAPRSPPVAPPTLNGKDYGPNFGTIRGVPSAFHQSQENLTVKHTPHHSRNQTLPVNLIKTCAPPPPPPGLNPRPSVPPPSRPPVPPPPSRTASNMNLKAPLSPPPPPPVCVAPPPPPHRTCPAPPHSRPPPAVPPPPPVRNSSMRNGHTATTTTAATTAATTATSATCLDFDTRYGNLFHPPSDFLPPNRFQGFTKIYSTKSGIWNDYLW